MPSRHSLVEELQYYSLAGRMSLCDVFKLSKTINAPIG